MIVKKEKKEKNVSSQKRSIDEIIRENEELMKNIRENRMKFNKKFGN